MGKYVDGTLIAGETVAYETSYHWVIFVPGLVFTACGVVTFGLSLLLGIPLLIKAWIDQATSEFAITTRRVIIKTGWISRRTIEMSLSKVESVDVGQGILGRILGYGTIMVIGTGGTREPFTYIRDPAAFRRAVQSNQP